MRKEIRTVDAARGIVQVSTVDERWYALTAADPATGLPTYRYLPSVTWITSFYPKGVGFMKWLASTGWNEAEAAKVAGGERGSKVHQAITRLIDGETVGMEDPVAVSAAGQPEPLSLEEYEAVMSFVAWWREAQPETVARDVVVVSETHGYAGTLDWLGRVGGRLTIVDFKTGQDVWPSHEIQVSAYKHALPESGEEFADPDLAILQLGYRKNRARWKWTPVADQFDLFLAAKAIWAKETAGQAPLQRDYPLALALDRPLPGEGEATPRRARKAVPASRPAA